MPDSTQRRVLGEQSPSEHNRLQVRLVPYSPPRLSAISDGTCAPCPCQQPEEATQAPVDNSSSRIGSPNVSVHGFSRPWTRSWSRSRPSPSLCSSTSSLHEQQRFSQPLRRRRARLVTIRAGSRTFSIRPVSRPGPINIVHQRHSSSISGTIADDEPVSPLTPLPEQSSSSRPQSRDSHPETVVSSRTLRNQRLVDGLRRVRHPRRYIRASVTLASPSPVSARVSSSQSVLSISTLSSRRNYRTYGDQDDSPALPSLDLTPSSANVRVLAESTPDGVDSDINVAIHGQASSVPVTRLRTEFSRESMVVPPLRYKSSSPAENSASWRSRSGSRASASSFTVDEVTRSLFAAVRAPRRPRRLEQASDATAPCPCQRCGHVLGLEPPPALLGRHPTRQQSRGTIRAIRDHDEHGDGLADLDHIPSRPRLYSLRSSLSSDRPLPSSSGSRRSSLSRSSIPAWARLYYGSGERRFLAAKSSLDSLSSFYDRRRPSTVEDRRARAGTIDSRLTEVTHFTESRPEPMPLSNRWQEFEPSCQSDNAASIPPPTPCHSQPLRQQTSSIWSPHLGRDRRAVGYSIWEPPSSLWSRSRFGSLPRDFQQLFFVAGFVCPIAWMVASLLPLPPRPPRDELIQEHCNTSQFHLRLEANHLASDDLLLARRYSRARWWRSLNRAMSILGVFVIGAAVALIIFGVKQKRL
ncbi:hypothetical protein CDD81_2773 [Ophiocordyceps australis]|uniref:Serine-rich protein n=1 Tax=Ophiocordyceps australis TaxID=1399860 RepID=A0A2C5XX07_9HYPO|nr:hypothetical protein CDD81_2773 [Ophiocordyceps australis]